MGFIVIILFFVVIVRFSIATEYRPGMWMGPYGAVSGLSVFFLAGVPGPRALFFGLVSAVVLWVWLTLMDKSDGTLFWWPLLFSGILIPIWLAVLFTKVIQ